MLHETVAIPQPPKKFFVGNALEVAGANSAIEALMRLARDYGELYRIEMPQNRMLVASSGRLMRDICDDHRFGKRVGAALQALQPFGSAGLFTATTDDPNWKKAHNILLPNFSQSAMKNYHPMMLEIAEQLVHKWDRLAATQAPVDIAADATRLTFDTIGLCGFGSRFDSLQHDELHPFVQAMIGYLGETQAKMRRLPMIDFFCVAQHKKFWEDVAVLNETISGIVKERLQSQERRYDLLSCMLEATDRESGEKLDEANVRAQCLTFLVAGHETTSGLLTFAMYYLVKNPVTMQKAQEEVDRVFGTDPSVWPSYEQVRKLEYIPKILKESLRLWPTAPGFSRSPFEDTIIGGRYKILKDEQILVLLPMLHRDKEVWGEDAETFNPDRFTAEVEETNAYAYKPFGQGVRACIGRQFALHEAALVLGMIMQRYTLDDFANYTLRIKQTLTVKPDGMHLKLQPRAPRTTTAAPPASASAAALPTAPPQPAISAQHTPLLVLYGSNLGASEAFATRIFNDGRAAGFDALLAPLDDYVDRLPREGAVLIVSSSYNGTPPDNAARFCQWIKDETDPKKAEQVRYAVFGCGNREWAATYQAIPTLIDERLAALGAQRIAPLGAADANDDFDGDFARWYQTLWPQVGTALGIEAPSPIEQGLLLDMEVLEDHHPSPFVASFQARPMVLVANDELHGKASERSTRHIEVALPESVTYTAGDHLGIIPQNDVELVKRVASRFGLLPETRIRLTLKSAGKTSLPVDQIVSVGRILTEFVELQEVATRRQIQLMADNTECPPEKMQLARLCGNDDENYRTNILEKSKSLIDLLDEFPACAMTFNTYLAQLTPMKPRYYSISSSPRLFERIASITVGVVDAPARSGHGRYRGTCSNYVARMPRGKAVYAFVRDTKSAFRMPSPSTPMIMIGPGTGIAPFRGFIQERAALQQAGTPIARSLLFFGCRNPEHDYIYRDELERYAAQGVIDLITAFSRVTDRCYVQDQIRAHRDQVWDLLENGAAIYVCGDASKMAPDVRRAFVDICKEKGVEDPEARIAELEAAHRYLTDVWA